MLRTLTLNDRLNLRIIFYRKNSMKKMFLLFSHKLTTVQMDDAKESLGVETFVELCATLQEEWSNVPAEFESLDTYFLRTKIYLLTAIKKVDIVLVQGDFGATCMMVSFVKSLGGVAVYATSKRDVSEKTVAGKVVKTSVFEHVRFREYK